MGKLPSNIKLSPHAKERLLERKNADMIYNIQNIMRSSVKWYGKDDLIYDCALYRHCCYTTRQSNQVGYITDGNIEIIYNKNTHIAITVLEVKDKFKPIKQFIKPEILKQIEIKKERIVEMKEKTEPKLNNNICKDCGKESEEININGICKKCARRKASAHFNKRPYIRYLDLPKKEQLKIDKMSEAHIKLTSNSSNNNVADNTLLEIKNQSKSSQIDFVDVLRECGCEIPEKNLKDILTILTNTNKLKDIILTVATDDNQQAILDLEQALNVVERKLQHDWEFNGFQETDDAKFKGFLTWRRVLKGAIFFWKKLYQTGAIIEMQKAWNAYAQDPNDKILLAGDRMNSTMKRFQITTDSISTIFNTRRPFTRVFYATDKEHAYAIFKQWMADRNLHEDTSKTTIVELNHDDK